MLLRKDPILRFRAPTKGFLTEARGQVAEPDDAAACLRLRWSNLLVPHTLFDANGGIVQVHVFPLEAERLGDTYTGGKPWLGSAH